MGTERAFRPLTGRELNEQHKALIEAGASPAFTLAWLERETERWRTEDEDR